MIADAEYLLRRRFSQLGLFSTPDDESRPERMTTLIDPLFSRTAICTSSEQLQPARRNAALNSW
jgi:hypothetical protein